MSTAPEPTVTDAPARPDIAHLRCLICFPKWIPGGTYAVCGQLFQNDNPEAPPDRERCVVCVDMDEPHFLAHFVNGEIPE